MDIGGEPRPRVSGTILHGADVRALAWQGSEVGLIASADEAGTLRVWATGYDGAPRLLVMLAAGHAAADIAFAGDRLVSVGKDGTLRVWMLPDLRPFEPAKPTTVCMRCQSPEDWLAETRRRIGRDFSADERRRFAIGEGAAPMPMSATATAGSAGTAAPR